MNKDNQIKRIKQLISEDTLYGKHIDKVVLNEGPGTKGGGVKTVVDDILKLFNNTSVKSIDLPKIKKEFISNIDDSLKGIANRADVDKLKKYLDAGIDGNIYDDLSSQIKVKLSPLRDIETDIIDTQGNPIKSTLYKQLSESIDRSISEAKKSNLYKNFGADDMPSNFDELIPGISKSYKIGKKSNFLFNYNMKRIEDFLIKELKLFTGNIWDGNSKKVINALVGDKSKKWHKDLLKKYFNAQFQLYGGKATFYRLLGVAFAKAGFMVYYFCPKTTGKIKLEQKEELSTAGKAQRGGDFFLDLLAKTFHPETYINPFGTLADLSTKHFGGEFDFLRFLDLTDIDCEKKEEYEEAKNAILDYDTDFKQIYEDSKVEAIESVNTNLKKMKKDTIKFIQNKAEEQGIPNLTEDDIKNFLIKKDSTGSN